MSVTSTYSEPMQRKLSAAFTRAIKEFLDNVGPSTAPPIDTARPPGSFHMQPGMAYRGKDNDAARGWILVMFEREEDAQAAFNAIVSAVPDGLEIEVLEWTPTSRIQFMLLSPNLNYADPFSQHGYLGMKWKRQ